MITELESLPDVSFIDDINLDAIDEQMVEDYQNKYNELTGETVALERGEPIALILYACAVQLYQMYMYIDKAGKENLLKYSEGQALDNIAANRGITRNAARSATTAVKFILSEAQAGVVAIPQGTRVTDGNVYFATDEYAEIPAGKTEVIVDCTAEAAGEESNDLAIGAINTLVDPIPYVAEVTNTIETTGGTDIESDDSLKERLYYASSSYSTAGPEDSYKYWIKTFNQNITDETIESSIPGEVDITFLLDGEIPNETVVKALQEYLNDETIRPLTDKVVVSTPTPQKYSIDLKYYINSSDSAKVTTIQSDVEAAVEDYALWQRSKIGRDINPSELIKRVIAAGAKRVEITAPDFTKVAATGIAQLDTKSVLYGGIEDD